MGYIYKLTNRTTGKIYIGATSLPLDQVVPSRFFNQTTKYIFANGMRNVRLEILEETDNLQQQRTKWREHYNKTHTTYKTENQEKEKLYKRPSILEQNKTFAAQFAPKPQIQIPRRIFS